MARDKKLNKKNVKTKFITVRATEAEKNKLKSRAEESGQKLSRYLIDMGLNGSMCRASENSLEVRNTVLLQELCNYIEEKYGEDAFLNEWSDKLWDSWQ